jgi:predicted dienelactone hydrolase
VAVTLGEQSHSRLLLRGALLFFACALGSTPLLVSSARAVNAPNFKVGVARRAFKIDKPYNWRNAKTHALLTTIWYPAAETSVEQPQWIGPPDHAFAKAGMAAPDAPLAASGAKFPLILLSHGSGGSALQMAWLGTTLAARGYIAAAVNHPGNNGYDGYTPQGFAIWWERARDLSMLIDQMLADATFGPRIDRERIGAAGFSLGGYTMIEIAGGITDRSQLQAFCDSPRADAMCKPPLEFPSVVEQYPELSRSDPEFQEALRHASDSYRDIRVRAVFAIAPAFGPAFSPASLKKVSIPVEIVAGARDQVVPIESSAKYFAAHIRGSKLIVFPGSVDHYVFLDTCTEVGQKSQPMLCSDAPGVDRDAIHAKTVELALKFFAEKLR